MSNRCFFAFAAFFACSVSIADAQVAEDGYSGFQAAIRSVFSTRPYFVWESASGDVNGDGVEDVSVIAVSNDDLPRQERLLVLAGRSDGKYNLISVSGEYCGVRKFYSLNIVGSSLHVQGFSATDATGSESVTLHFRYSEKLSDFELVGREDASRNYERESSYSVSTNYLTKFEVHTRKSGKRHREFKIRLKNPKVHRLRGFDCSSLDEMSSGVYIDERMHVVR